MVVGSAMSGAAFAYQGHMWNAKNDLVAALGQLQAAVPDKGGHRVNAINLTQQAISETQAGIRFGRGY
jgi:hypothetical protein